MRRLGIIPILCIVVCHTTLLADYVHTWTTYGRDGCKEWKTIQKEGFGCRNFWRPCGRDYWSEDGCGWSEECNGIVIPSDATSDPFVVTSDHGIIYSVAPGTGGSYSPLGEPYTCGMSGNAAYTMWIFIPNGGDHVSMPPAMTQLN